MVIKTHMDSCPRVPDTISIINIVFTCHSPFPLLPWLTETSDGATPLHGWWCCCPKPLVRYKEYTSARDFQSAKVSIKRTISGGVSVFAGTTCSGSLLSASAFLCSSVFLKTIVYSYAASMRDRRRILADAWGEVALCSLSRVRRGLWSVANSKGSKQIRIKFLYTKNACKLFLFQLRVVMLGLW